MQGNGGIHVPCGVNGRILRVDLTSNAITVQAPPEEFYREYLGGSLLATYYLLSESSPRVDAFDPHSMLAFAPGLLNASGVGGTAKFSVAGKSPLTGAFAESEAGGFWGPELLAAGFDAIIVVGKAPNPSYLWIHDGNAELRDATSLWGKSTAEVQGIIRSDLGDEKVRVAQIGPAGENLVRFACIVNDLVFVNGRTGLGAVMGSKNLRAIAVRGTKRPSPADKDALRRIYRWFSQTWRTTPNLSLHEMGTSGAVTPLNAGEMLPTRNFTAGRFDGAPQVSGETLNEKYVKGRRGCLGCPVRCKREVEVEGRYRVNPVYGGPEYETIGSFGPMCGVSDIEAICKAHELCNAYGMDTISTGVTIAFAMECYEKGFITREDTNGLDLAFGNEDGLVSMVEAIAQRKGIGDLLAEGSRRAAVRIGRGAADLAMHVKGLEIPMHEPRGKRSLALAYTMAPIGADHQRAPHDIIFERPGRQLDQMALLGVGEPVPKTDLSATKVRLFVKGQQLWTLFNILGICQLVGAPNFTLTIPTVVETVNAVTGWNTSIDDLMAKAEKQMTMARLFNIEAGLTPADDVLPKRFSEALTTYSGIGEQEFEDAKRLYYELMHWDCSTGEPLKERLIELGLAWLAGERPGAVIVRVAVQGLKMDNGKMSRPEPRSAVKPSRFITLSLGTSATAEAIARKLGIDPSSVGMVVVNEELASMKSVIRDGDEVKFYPFIEGG